MPLKIFILAILVLLFSCDSEKKANSDENLDPNVHKVVVNEVKQAKVYTYLNVSENDHEYWMAIAKKEVEEGDVYYYTQSLEMKDFESKELDKTFDAIYFVDKISDKPIKLSPRMMGNNPHSKVQTNLKNDVSVNPAADGITIAELFSNKDQYSGELIKIKGQVIKYNSEIMGKNWVQIQDGTNFDNNFELTITTRDQVKRGDIVTFEGKITLNKDFGAGYAYDVVMEEGKMLEKSIQN